MELDYLATIRQTLPRLVTVAKHLEPTFHFGDVSQVTTHFLARHNYEAVVWDVDGTLMAYHGADIAPQFAPQIRQLFRESTVRHAVLSNCDEVRYRQLGKIFPEVPVLRVYRTSHDLVLRTQLSGKDSHSDAQVNAILVSGGKHLRKPSGVLIEQAMDFLGVTDPVRVVVVGDQYTTDVASANLACARSVKVPTFAKETFPLTIRLTQSMEAFYYRLHYRVR